MIMDIVRKLVLLFLLTIIIIPCCKVICTMFYSIYCCIAILLAVVNVISLVVFNLIFGLEHLVNLDGDMRVVIIPNLVESLKRCFQFPLFSQTEHSGEVENSCRLYLFSHRHSHGHQTVLFLVLRISFFRYICSAFHWFGSLVVF